MALPDYSCLFKDNTDTMFDAIKFGVAIVTQEAFDALPEQQTWNYAWQYDTAPVDDRAEKDAATDFMKVVNKTASLQDFVPEYENQAIIFTGDDLGSDRAMIAVLLYIVIAIMAFVFSVTTSIPSPKRRASSARCGPPATAGASWCTTTWPCRWWSPLSARRWAMYWGTRCSKNVCVDMYYGSYSLPTYVTRWNADAFWMTTVIPVALMIFINWLVLSRTMRISPLQFLRHDLSRPR